MAVPADVKLMFSLPGALVTFAAFIDQTIFADIPGNEGVRQVGRCRIGVKLILCSIHTFLVHVAERLVR